MKSFVATNVCLLATVLLFSATLQAAPSVSGNIISLPDNGWYQVQSKENYSSICQGVRQCEVSAGDYIVINHTTAERFEVSVAGDATATEVTVVRNTIRWPNDGWYQVQNATDYTSVCEGRRLCTVEPGTYNVINLTTGKRFNNIVVSGILGFGDHRFDANEYKPGFELRLLGRTYGTQEQFLLTVLQEKPLISAYFSESLASHIDRVVDQAPDIQQSQDVVEVGNKRSWHTVVTTTTAVYDCDAGGSMTYNSVAEIAYPSPSSIQTHLDESHLKQAFEFNECRSVYSSVGSNPYRRSDIHPYGEYTMNGNFVVEISSNSRPSKNWGRSIRHSWNSFNIVAAAPSLWSISADGDSRYYRYATTMSGVYTDISSNYNYVYTGESGDVREQITASIPGRF